MVQKTIRCEHEKDSQQVQRRDEISQRRDASSARGHLAKSKHEAWPQERDL
jgi:hypothetical protein